MKKAYFLIAAAFILLMLFIAVTPNSLTRSCSVDSDCNIGYSITCDKVAVNEYSFLPKTRESRCTKITLNVEPFTDSVCLQKKCALVNYDSEEEIALMPEGLVILAPADIFINPPGLKKGESTTVGISVRNNGFSDGKENLKIDLDCGSNKTISIAPEIESLSFNGLSRIEFSAKIVADKDAYFTEISYNDTNKYVETRVTYGQARCWLSMNGSKGSIGRYIVLNLYQ